MRLIAQAPQLVGDVSYLPGDVLPSSMHAWPLLPEAIRRGSIWVEGTPVSSLLDAHTGAVVTVEPRIALGMIRRGQLVSSDPNEPAPLHAAAIQRDIQQRVGLVQRFQPPAPPGESLPEEPLAAEPQTSGNLPGVERKRRRG